MICPDAEDLVLYTEGDTPNAGIESHLDGCDACRAAVALLVQTATPPPSDMLLSARFELQARLGEGGMGVVYAAFDRRLKTPVALKMLRPDLPDDTRQRLEHEARLARSIRHPNVCAVFDVAHSEGMSYLIMERLDGQTLTAWLSQPDPEAGVAVLGQILAGLAAAHEAGILHRDLKPDNIMIAADGTTKILDFGLATPSETARPGQIGTRRWWAPEQARGEPATAASDVFALGRIGAAILGPSATVPRRKYRRWLARCTAEQASERFPDAVAAGQAWARLHRPRWPAAVAVFAGAVVIALVSWAALSRPAETPLHAIAILDVDNQSGDAQLDDISGLFASALARAPGLRVIPPWSVPADKTPPEVRTWCLENAVPVVARARLTTTAEGLTLSVHITHLDSPAERAVIQATAATKAGVPALVDTLAAQLLRRSGRAPPAGHWQVSAARNAEAFAAWQRGHRRFTRRKAWDAVTDFRAAVEANPDFVSAALWLAIALDWSGERAGARDALGEVIARVDQLSRADRRLMLAMDAKLRGDWRGAGRHLEVLLQTHPEMQHARFMLGDLAFHAGEFAQAATRLTHAIEHAPNDRLARHHLVWALFSAGRLDDAQAAAARWRTLGHLNAFVVSGELALASGDPSTALALAREGEQSFPGAPLLRHVAAFSRLATGDAPAAHAALDAPEFDPNEDRETHLRHAWMDAWSGDIASADARYAQLLAHFSSSQVPYSGRYNHALLERVWLAAQRPAMRPKARAWLADLVLDSTWMTKKYVAQYMALACWSLQDAVCLSRAARSGWPMAKGLDLAFRAHQSGGPARAVEVLDRLIDEIEVYNRDALRPLRIELNLALHRRAAAQRDIDHFEQLRFVRPQHLLVRAWVGCLKARLDRRGHAPACDSFRAP